MRLILTTLISIFLIGSISSCKKCQTCVASDEDGVTVYTYPEVCGTKRDLDAYAELCATEYGMFDFNCSCSED